MLLSKYKSRIQTKFEGGGSLSVDWHENAQEAGEALLIEINPTTLKRRVPLYGGLNSATNIYYCPADMRVPSTLYSNTTREKWTYVAPQAYHLGSNDYEFTIETINGVRFLLIRHSLASGSLDIDSFDSVGSKTGVALTVNTFNYLSGTGALEGTFSDTLTDVIETLATAIDITDYKRGSAIVPTNFTTAEDVASVQLILETDASNYYTMTSTADGVGDHFIDGWNITRFDLAKAVATGTPVDTNITAYKLVLTMATGTSQTVIIDKLQLEKTVHYNFEYYSRYMFIDKDDGSWKEISGDDADIINLSTDEANIMVYEGARLVSLGATKPKAKRGKNTDFDVEVTRKYNAYWAENPSTALPQSYDGGAGISKTFL